MRLSRRKKICYPVFAKFNERSQKDQREINWKIFVWGGFFVLVFAAAVYLVIFSSAFRIKDIEVSGNKLISTEQILGVTKETLGKKFLKFIPVDTVFALGGNKIKNNLLSAFPEIESVQIKRGKMNELDIVLSERKSGGILCLAQVFVSPSPEPSDLMQGTSTPAASATVKEALPESNGCFFVDETGFVYRQAPEISGTLLPTFYSFSPDVCRIGAQGIDASSLVFAAEVKKELRQADVDLVGFVFGDEIGPDLKAFTGEGWVIYFDPTRSALTQVKILEALLQGEIKNKRATLQYVDLRAEDRVYYK